MSNEEKTGLREWVRYQAPKGGNFAGGIKKVSKCIPLQKPHEMTKILKGR